VSFFWPLKLKSCPVIKKFFKVLFSILLPLTPIRFSCVKRMLWLNLGLMQRLQWQSDAQTTQFDLIHNSARLHSSYQAAHGPTDWQLRQDSLAAVVHTDRHASPRRSSPITPHELDASPQSNYICRVQGTAIMMFFKKIIEVHGYIGVKSNSKTFL
jgi:hypothetical protein